MTDKTVVATLCHRSNPERTATLEQEKGPVLVLRHTDAAGKSRKKSFKGKSKQKKFALDDVWRNALRFLCSEGFVAPATQSALLSWLSFTDEEYPRDEPFALDSKGGFVWVGDTGFVRRIKRHTCEQVDISLGHPKVGVREMGCDAAGIAYALVEVSSIPVASRPAWSRPSEGPYAFDVIRVTEAGTFERLVNAGYTGAERVLIALSVANDGTFLGPHAEGAGLYNAKGKPIAKYAVGVGDGYPKGGLSPNGQWVALSQEGGQVRVLCRDGDFDALSKDRFSDLSRIEISDEGITNVYGHGPKQWGIYRLSKSLTAKRISDNIHAQPTPDKKRVLEIGGPASEGWAALHKNGGEDKPTARSKMPMLLGRYGRTRFWDDGQAMIRTRGNILAEIDIAKLEKQK